MLQLAGKLGFVMEMLQKQFAHYTVGMAELTAHKLCLMYPQHKVVHREMALVGPVFVMKVLIRRRPCS